ETIWETLVPERAGESPSRGQPPNRPNVIETDILLSTLDKDRDKAISADELAAAPTVLHTLDKNQVDKLSEDELAPAPAAASRQDGRRVRGGVIQMMKFRSALDGVCNGSLARSEIKYV